VRILAVAPGQAAVEVLGKVYLAEEIPASRILVPAEDEDEDEDGLRSPENRTWDRTNLQISIFCASRTARSRTCCTESFRGQVTSGVTGRVNGGQRRSREARTACSGGLGRAPRPAFVSSRVHDLTET
jgi:hypothetical protein